MKIPYDLNKELMQKTSPSMAFDGSDFALWQKAAREKLAKLLGMDKFEKVVVYYDNGQDTLGAIIDALLINKNNVEHRVEFDHKEKRLFQVSDMLTFIDKLVYKHNNNIFLTNAEKYLF